MQAVKPVLLLLLIIPSLVSAQADSTRLDTLRAITVTATRLPVRAPESPLAVSILTERDIRWHQPQLSLQESLAAVPGVFMLNDANFAQDLRIAIRGFGARAGFGIRGIKILLDGIPESAPDGQAQVDNLDLAAIHRMEVLRGASGGLYGNASGGVISLATAPAPDSLELEARLAGGRYGFRQVHAQGGTAFEKTAFRLALTHLGLDGYREHAAMRSTLANGRWTWTPDSTLRLNLLLNYTHSPRADDPGALTAAQAEADRQAANPNNIRFRSGEALQQGRAGWVLEKRDKAGGQWRLRGYSAWRDFENRLPFANSGQVAFQRWFAGGGGQYERAFSRWRWSAGCDLDRQSDYRQRFDNADGARGAQNLDQQERFTSMGAFGLAEWRLARAWTLSGGLRLDAVQLSVRDFFDADGRQSGSETYRRLSPWGGVVARLNGSLQAYANLTTNFETPTLGELSANPANTGGFNPELGPQRTLSAEIGLRGRTATGLTWEAAFFHARTLDELAPYELPDFPGRTFYRNAGKTRRYGLETTLRWRPAAGLDLGLTGTLARFQYDRYATPAGDFNGRRLPGLPAFWGMADLRYEHRSGVTAQAQVRQTGAFFADDANAVRIVPYALLHLRVGWRWRKVEFFAGADNALNATYFNNIRPNAAGGRYFEPGAGAFVFAGVSYVR